MSDSCSGTAEDRSYDKLSTFILEHAAEYKKSKAAAEPVDKAPVVVAAF